MISTRYHGYPEPILATSDIMRKLAYGEWVYAQMENTFEPLLVDVSTNKRYAVPDEVDYLRGTIRNENIRYNARG